MLQIDKSFVIDVVNNEEPTDSLEQYLEATAYQNSSTNCLEVELRHDLENCVWALLIPLVVRENPRFAALCFFIYLFNFLLPHPASTPF